MNVCLVLRSLTGELKSTVCLSCLLCKMVLIIIARSTDRGDDTREVLSLHGVWRVVNPHSVQAMWWRRGGGQGLFQGEVKGAEAALLSSPGQHVASGAPPMAPMCSGKKPLNPLSAVGFRSHLLSNFSVPQFQTCNNRDNNIPVEGLLRGLKDTCVDSSPAAGAPSPPSYRRPGHPEAGSRPWAQTPPRSRGRGTRSASALGTRQSTGWGPRKGVVPTVSSAAAASQGERRCPRGPVAASGDEVPRPLLLGPPWPREPP